MVQSVLRCCGVVVGAAVLRGQGRDVAVKVGDAVFRSVVRSLTVLGCLKTI